MNIIVGKIGDIKNYIENLVLWFVCVKVIVIIRIYENCYYFFNNCYLFDFMSCICFILICLYIFKIIRRTCVDRVFILVGMGDVN